MHIHILAICGTFMAGLAVLAKQLGHTVTGSDAAVYPPMSTQLEAQGITCYSGYAPEHLQPAPDQVIIGNVLSRGNPAVEYVFNQGLPYISGAQWLLENVLRDRWVLAIAGTHGKTTTTSMVAWILEYAQLSPGFLIGGVPENFGVSARLGERPFFVVEADEYDTAFFDKRSKFVHYRPRTAVLNNLEFDHADIFPDLAAIQRQFHHFVRTVPSQGLIIHSSQKAIMEVLAQGCWTPLEILQAAEKGWYYRPLNIEFSEFEVFFQEKEQGTVKWSLIGQHNAHNALAAIAAARHAGVPTKVACEALQTFKNVKRRLEICGVVKGITVYDDFAHHPTAIAATLKALRQRVGQQPITAVVELRSNSMRMGVFQNTLAEAFVGADQIVLQRPAHLDWSLETATQTLSNLHIFAEIDEIIAFLVKKVSAGEHILIMSNGAFGNIHVRLLEALSGNNTVLYQI